MNNIILRIKPHKLKKNRELKGLSQENMATAIGLSQSQYSRLEKGSCEVSLKRVIEISTVLNIALEEIVETSGVSAFIKCKNCTDNYIKFENERKILSDKIGVLEKQNAILTGIIDNLKPV